ncbi:ecdysone oxidase-like [Oppia nitens]|uniref:ecdysone oxidase-like n=1 Tax=Oppia nitens TaxID=1686743 RepID=UPI0023DB1AC2|nr:ecdysone oxidase-like [Oppia nitens]
MGTGSSGTTVAARLAENSKISVLLLEAGGNQNLYNDVPAFDSKLTATDQNWNYPIVSQNYSYLAYVDNRVNIQQGRVFGGSSAINSMNYYRECPDYYRLWSDITGVKNWSFADVLPFFLKTENNLDNDLVFNEPMYHRSGGELTVITPAIDVILKNYIIASKQLGYKWTHMDGRNPMGTTYIQKTIDSNGYRESIAKVFLENRSQKNLRVLGNSLVTKILINHKKQAIGVEVYRKAKIYQVFAKKEVIISAGAIGSPKLLMLSGIGPSDHLKKLNIPVVSDLKVGYNMIYPSLVDSNTISFDIINQSLVEKPLETFKNIYNFFVNHSGPLRKEVSGVTCFPEMSYNSTYPQLSNGCVLPRTSYIDTDLDALVAPYKHPDQWRQYFRPYLNRTSFSLFALIKRTKSVGRIQLASIDPLEEPIIDPCLFCDKNDIDDLVKSIKLSLKIYTSTHMKKYIKPFKYPIPGCTPCLHNYFCDTYLKCIVQANTHWILPMGGCRIGVSPKSDAVVDENFKVFGVSNLRVINSCIIPVATEQINAISVMIGEYGAHKIINNF